MNILSIPNEWQGFEFVEKMATEGFNEKGGRSLSC